MGKNKRENVIEINYILNIMKALGWYIHMRKDITQNELATKMNLDPAVISRFLISPKIANDITHENYSQSKKRLIEIERAIKICEHLDITLESLLYFYQFKNNIDNVAKIDKIRKLTNSLILSDNGDALPYMPDTDDTDSSLLQSKTNVLPTMPAHANSLISNVNHPDFQRLRGKYYCYFSSTSSEEVGKRNKPNIDMSNISPELIELYDCMTNEYIFCGILDIHNHPKSQDNLCHVDFKFLSNPEKQYVKRYSGILTLSANTKAVFCELTSDEQGEKTYIIFEKQDLGKEHPHIQCCMAMVLTYSSKVNRRRPCCEHMIISSKIIREGTEAYDLMKAYLRMNDNTIRITQSGYNELLEDINASADPDLKKIATEYSKLQQLAGNTVIIENCAFIPESTIYKLQDLTDSQKQKFEILLRIHSIAPWYCKTKATKADTIFKSLNTPLD